MKTVVAMIVLSALLVALLTKLFIRYKKRKNNRVTTPEATPVHNNKIRTKKEPKYISFNGTILCERPKGMSYRRYRQHLLGQKIWLKQRLSGRIVHDGGGFRGDASKLK